MVTLRNFVLIVLAFSALTLGLKTPVLAQSQSITEPDALPAHRGSAKDLSGIRARNSLIWFGGVGGGDDNDEVEESVYEMRQPSGSLPLFDPERVPIDWNENSGEPRSESVLIPLTQF